MILGTSPIGEQMLYVPSGFNRFEILDLVRLIG